jgi:hypothetical protein
VQADSNDLRSSVNRRSQFLCYKVIKYRYTSSSAFVFLHCKPLVLVWNRLYPGSMDFVMMDDLKSIPMLDVGIVNSGSLPTSYMYDVSG